MQLHESIKALREGQGMSQEELARAVGYRDRSSIAKVEAGKVDLSLSKIAAFAAALGVSPAALLGWSEAQQALEAAGLTATDAAEEMGLSPTQLAAAVQRGRDPETAQTILAVANALAAEARPDCTDKERTLIRLYRAATDKDRAVVDTVLGLEREG